MLSLACLKNEKFKYGTQMTSYEKLLEYVLEIGHLKSAAACLNWEQEVFMPPAGAESRATTLGTLEKIIHQKTVSSDYEQLLVAAEKENVESQKLSLIHI